MQKTILRDASGWREVDSQAERLAMRSQAVKLDAQQLRKKDAVIGLIYSEASQGRVYTARQFSDTFENKSGLGSSRSLRNRLNALSTKGHIKFFKNADIYGLPQAQRSRQGYICVEGMALGDGTRILPTHFKHPKTNEVLPVDDPENWIVALNSGGLS